MAEPQVAAAPESPPPPEGARCAFHPRHTAKETCERCGTFLCFRCNEFGDRGQTLCRPCFARTPFLAERGTRLVAAFLDGLITFFIPTLLAALTGFLFRRANPESEPISPLLAFIGLGITLSLQTVFLIRYGQSIGKRYMGIRVVRTDGHPASVARIILLRNLPVYLLGVVVPLVALVDTLFIYGGKRRCLHDFIAGTLVVKVPPVTNKSVDPT